MNDHYRCYLQIDHRSLMICFFLILLVVVFFIRIDWCSHHNNLFFSIVIWHLSWPFTKPSLFSYHALVTSAPLEETLEERDRGGNKLQLWFSWIFLWMLQWICSIEIYGHQFWCFMDLNVNVKGDLDVNPCEQGWTDGCDILFGC